MKIVIIIPTYNERVNISKLLPLLEEEIFPQLKHHKMNILVVDDSSPDGTGEEVKKFKEKWHNIVLLTGTKQGLGAAYVRGMKYAMDTMGAEAVVEFDADFQHNPHDIPKLIGAMDNGADYVIGSRYIPGGSIPKDWGMDRKFLSVFGSLFTRLIWWNFSIHDMTSGFKLTKTSFLKRVDLDHLISKHFSYKMQILHDVVKLGAKVKEVPIVFFEREKGTSKISQKDQFESFYVVVMVRLLDFKRVIKFLVVGGTGFIVQLLVIYLVIVLFKAQQFVATMIGGEAAILSNFALNSMWTFKDTGQLKQKGGLWHRLVKFNTASLLSIAVQTIVVAIAVRLIGEQVHLFGHLVHTSLVIVIPTIILIVIPMNYFIYNKIIWKTHHLKQKDGIPVDTSR